MENHRTNAGTIASSSSLLKLEIGSYLIFQGFDGLTAPWLGDLLRTMKAIGFGYQPRASLFSRSRGNELGSRTGYTKTGDAEGS
jgi:hypothetical protein